MSTKICFSGSVTSLSTGILEAVQLLIGLYIHQSQTRIYIVTESYCMLFSRYFTQLKDSEHLVADHSSVVVH